MDQEKPIELSLELSPGDFSLRLNGVVMNVRLKAASGLIPALPPGSLPLTEPPPGHTPGTDAESGEKVRLVQEVSFYQQAYQWAYQEIGKLAKEINLSLQDLSLVDLIKSSATSPGERLDQLRDQVADVLEITEKAALNILELVEEIREDCLGVQRHLLSLAHPSAVPEAEAGPGLTTLGESVVAQGEALSQELYTLLQVSPGGSMVPTFSLAAILQGLLEFCGSEQVKPHLKAMLAQQESLFLPGEVEAALGHLAAEVPVEYGLHQFPVANVLEILLEQCQEDQVRELLSKLQASSSKVFPMPALPLEGRPLETPGGSGAPSGVLSRWEDFWQDVRQLAAQAGGPHEAPLSEDGAAGASVQEALDTVDRINSSLSRIMEALAFQDLSGQRLLKVLKILRQLQVQVLTILIAAGNKLKMRVGEPEAMLPENAILAQEELDRMLQGAGRDYPARETGAAEPEDQQPLDQEAINELLTSMGF